MANSTPITEKLKGLISKIRPDVKDTGLPVWEQMFETIYKDVREMEEKRDLLITESGRIVLNILQQAQKERGTSGGECSGTAKSIIMTICNVSCAWAAFRPGGIFEVYFWNEKEAQKVKDTFGWICEIKKIDSSDYRLLINI